ncbi:MAG: proline--tRNA ligase [Candidatus Micrarchaeota archaeon]|nr:proline--tRNA ligase [Candidatus Micrarchaeota archaeon]
MAMSGREFDKDKEKNFSEWYNTVIYAADLVDNRYKVQGFIVHKPWAMKIFKRLYSLFEVELEKDGHEPTLFPTVIPEENFEIEKEHAQGFVPNVFWITERGNEKLSRKLALRPTSETAMYQMYSLWIRDYTDLPIKLYQSCTVFRNEAETSPFMRGREFLWIEAHDAFSTEIEAREQIIKDIMISTRVIKERLGIECLFFQRPKWDTFAGAEHTYATDVLLPDGKTLQIASTHYLGQNFAKAFNIKFKDKDGNELHAYQTCYGPGIWRIMAAIIAVHGDNHGLVIPPAVAPLDVVIVPIVKSGIDNEKVIKRCREIKEILEKNGYKVILDERNKTPGYKYADWELRGVPIRIEIGLKEAEGDYITLVARDQRIRKSVNVKEIAEFTRKEMDEMTERLKQNTKKRMEGKIINAESMEEIKRILDEEKAYARINICSIEMDGKDCADIIQYETKGGKVRGILVGKKEEPFGNKKCVICGKNAKHVVYIARQY